MNLQFISQNLVQRGDEYIRNNGLDHFHHHAATLLKECRIAESFDLEETLKLGMRAEELATQNYKSFEFSDLPITISRGEFCFVDLYFWRRRPTTIHNHHFSGAFIGLLGKNVDLEFSFESKRAIGKFHEWGELKLLQERIISPGHVVSIAPLDGFIHQNHHQSDLTVNLCFRTLDIKNESLSGYLYSGLRHSKDPQLMMRVERLKRLLNFGPVDLASVGLDEAMAFLIQNYDSGISHPRFQELIASCQEKIQAEAGLNLEELLQSHWKMIEDLEEQYE